VTRISSLGPYQIESLLGTGGTGEVYRARDSRLGRLVALKILRADRAAGAYRQRLLQEARVASALNHPHIVTVYDVGVQDDIDYIAMELVDGDSLATVLARGPIGTKRAVAYAAQVADALARAHEAGIIHRDIKPANLMIGRDDCVKVLDFGVAKVVDEMRRAVLESAVTTMPPTGEGAIVGTFAYMSPEQAQGRPIDARSDVFSLGALLYEMTAGRPAFRRDSSVDTLAAIVREEPTPLDKVVPDVPAELLHIITRCLQKDPSRRFQSMADLHFVLQDLVDDPGSQKSQKRAHGLLPRVLAGGAVLLALAGGALWISRWLAVPNRTTGAMSVSRLTFDQGLQTEPSWSPDGRFLAYTADRQENFDIYVQQVSGGNPVRVTSSPALDWQPDWSPDGNRLVFRSERDGGGLFVVPALGGQEQKISSIGYRPRWSPDGRRVLFVSSAMPISEVPDVYVVGPELGDPPRRILTSALRDFRSVWSVQWHPTRDVLTFLGRKGDRGWDLWTASADAAAPARFEVPEAVKAQIVSVASVTWNPDGESLYLEGTSPAGVTNVYAAVASVDRPGHFPTPQMLTSGLQDSEIAVSRDGRRLAYTRRQERNRIWRLPLDREGVGTPEGTQAVTSEDVHALLSDATVDGTRLAFIAFRDGQTRQELWETSLVTAEARARLVDDFRRVALRWSRDGRRLAYRRSSYDATRTHGQHSMVLFDPETGSEEPVTSRVQDAFDIPSDWSADGKWILGSTNRLDGHSAVVKYPLGAAPKAETRLEVIAQCTDCDLWQARYSPDGSWIAFTRVPRGGIGESVIHLVRSAGGTWTPITDRGRWADKPRWTSDGSRLYFISNRETGLFNVWSQRINPADGRPIGEPTAVTRFNGPRVMINPLLASVELSAVPGALILPIMELSGNIWILTRTME